MHNEKERNAKALLITNDKVKALAGFLQEPLLFNFSIFQPSIAKRSYTLLCDIMKEGDCFSATPSRFIIIKDFHVKKRK